MRFFASFRGLHFGFRRIYLMDTTCLYYLSLPGFMALAKPLPKSATSCTKVGKLQSPAMQGKEALAGKDLLKVTSCCQREPSQDLSLGKCHHVGTSTSRHPHVGHIHMCGTFACLAHPHVVLAAQAPGKQVLNTLARAQEQKFV